MNSFTNKHSKLTIHNARLKCNHVVPFWFIHLLLIKSMKELTAFNRFPRYDTLSIWHKIIKELNAFNRFSRYDTLSFLPI